MGTGEIGNTNMGGVVFEAGIIEIDDPAKIKLTLTARHEEASWSHGYLQQFVQDGIYATFKLITFNRRQ